MKQPTVGRIVHFYTKDTVLWSNGVGEGPYPAIITQTFEGSMVNLKVLPPFATPYDKGSVVDKVDASMVNPEGLSTSCYWEWPPRD